MAEEIVGKQLGNFEILEEIGRGGMGVVYRARQISLNRIVALKVLPADPLLDEAASERFTREAHAMARLQHPNIVDVIEVGEQDGVRYFVMQYVEGSSLANILEHGCLTPQRAAEIGAEVSDALAHAHERGIVHRDIKPGNILITPEGRAIVTDFGIAKAMESVTTLQASLTQGAIGTPEYMSPEVIRGNPVDGRTDIYSLGVVLYQMLTGRVPFASATPYETAHRHLSDPPTPPTTMGTQCPAWLEAILLKALAKEPADRFATASAMSLALRRGPAAGVVVNTPAAAHTVAVDLSAIAGATPARSSAGGYIWALSGIGVGLVAIVLMLVFGSDMLHPEGPPPVSLTVPGVTGLTLGDAQSMLADRGLQSLRLADQHDPDLPMGLVLRQDPPAGAVVSGSSMVNLTVSLGPEPPTAVPNVVGLKEASAHAELTAAGFEPQMDQRLASAEFEAGLVIRQQPSAGSLQKPGAAVHLTISTGPQPTFVEIGMTTYENAEEGYALNVPDNWAVLESRRGDNNEYSRVEFTAPHADVSALVDCGPPGGDADQLASWESMDRRFEKAYGSKHTCISLDYAMLSGYEAGYWEFILTRDGECYQKIDVGADIDGRGLAVLCQAPPGEFEEYRDLFMEIIESFVVF